MFTPIADAVRAVEALASADFARRKFNCEHLCQHQLTDLPASAGPSWQRCSHCLSIFYKGTLWFPPQGSERI